MSASTTTTSDSIKRELQTTLAARQDVGPGYDDHFLDSIVDRLKTEVAQELRRELREGWRIPTLKGLCGR